MIQEIKKRILGFLNYRQSRLATDFLAGNVVIVTGATGGIGRAVIDVLRENNAKVVSVSRKKDDLEKMYVGMSDVKLIVADVTNENDVKRVITETLETFGKIDALVNTVGAFSEKSIEDISLDEFTSAIQTNIQSAFLLSQAVVPSMKQSRDGLIVHVGSKISRNTNIAPKKTLYALTKYALEGLCYALNKELKGTGVRVSCLMPGTTNTFLSMHADEFLSPHDVAEVIVMMIRHKNIDFENFVIKSKWQNI